MTRILVTSAGAQPHDLLRAAKLITAGQNTTAIAVRAG
jgi:hypothetical protein